MDWRCPASGVGGGHGARAQYGGRSSSPTVRALGGDSAGAAGFGVPGATSADDTVVAGGGPAISQLHAGAGKGAAGGGALADVSQLHCFVSASAGVVSTGAVPL